MFRPESWTEKGYIRRKLRHNRLRRLTHLPHSSAGDRLTEWIRSWTVRKKSSMVRLRSLCFCFAWLYKGSYMVSWWHSCILSPCFHLCKKRKCYSINAIAVLQFFTTISVLLLLLLIKNRINFKYTSLKHSQLRKFGDKQRVAPVAPTNNCLTLNVTIGDHFWAMYRGWSEEL